MSEGGITASGKINDQWGVYSLSEITMGRVIEPGRREQTRERDRERESERNGVGEDSEATFAPIVIPCSPARRGAANSPRHRGSSDFHMHMHR